MPVNGVPLKPECGISLVSECVDAVGYIQLTHG